MNPTGFVDRRILGCELKKPFRMRKINLQRCFVAFAIHSLFVCAIACADAGSVPDITPVPEPDAEAPYLEVSPTSLYFDIAGNALNAKGFVVKSNCAWRLNVPEQVNWLKASANSGEGTATVSFQLFVDTVYHAADLTFSAESADGQTCLSYSVKVQQGNEPSDSGSEPDAENPEEDPDQTPEPDPDTPPLSVPNIDSVLPTSLLWSDSDCAVSKTVTVGVSNFENHVLEASIIGPDADRFKTNSPVREGLVVRVTNVGANETDVDFTASLVISVEDGNRVIVPLSQSKRNSNSSGGNEDQDDNNGGSGSSDIDGSNGDSSDGTNAGGNGSGNTEDDKDGVSGGGGDDFSSLTPVSIFKGDVGPTSDGWIGENCAVYSGGGPFSDPYFPLLLGTDANVKGLSMNGNTAFVGKIISPELQGGCGVLSFNYGTTNKGDTQVDFSVDIQPNSGSVRTFRVKKTVEPLEKNLFSEEVNVAGPFRIVFTNNCPSKLAMDIDRYTVFHVRWTGHR